MLRLFKCFWFILFLPLPLLAQSVHESESWGGYITAIRLSDRLAIWNDAHFVPYNFFIHRHGLSYHFTNGARLSGG